MHVYVVFWRATSSNQSTIVSRAAGLGGEASGQHQQSQTSLGISDILRQRCSHLCTEVWVRQKPTGKADCGKTCLASSLPAKSRRLSSSSDFLQSR